MRPSSTFTRISKTFISLLCFSTFIFIACKKDRPQQQEAKEITGLWQLADAPKIHLHLKSDGTFTYENTKVEDHEPKATGSYRIQGNSIQFEVSLSGAFMEQAIFELKGDALFISYKHFNSTGTQRQSLKFSRPGNE